MSQATDPDAAHMRRAIALSKRGLPAPNPHVGCVLVRAGEIVGEGYHRFAGGPHAEAEALAQAGEAARGAIAYVTLEPCNHVGRTPACSQSLIRAGVAKVVYACKDPNPKAAGGEDALAAAGIPVQGGLLANDARAANEQFFFSIENRRPLFIAKAGISLDGRTALRNGESKWITSSRSRAEGRRLRAELGAVIVGRKTVEADDPELTARVPGHPNEVLRVVLDPAAKLSASCRVFDDQAETLHITGQIDLPTLAHDLCRRGVTGALIEGGAITIGRFLEAGLVDGLELFIAPKVLGAGPSWVEGFQVLNIDSAAMFEVKRSKRLGKDVWITARRRQNSL